MVLWRIFLLWLHVAFLAFSGVRSVVCFSVPSKNMPGSPGKVAFLLRAKKKGRGGINTGSKGPGPAKGGSGFGGAVTMEPCPCESERSYSKCCGRIHHDRQAYATATAAEVVRARYTAYARRVVDFIVESTHPLNPSYVEDLEHWKRTIASDCYDNFELVQCNILEENYDRIQTIRDGLDVIGEAKDEEVAIVRFQALMNQRDTRQKAGFVETSTFLRDEKTGAWLYRSGELSVMDSVAAQ